MTLKREGSMSVPVRDFTGWLKEAGLPTGVAELSALLNIKRTTLQNQKLRGRMTVHTVVSAARAAQLNPLDVLGQFPGYMALIDERMQVTTAELLSQVTYTDALVHLLSRIKGDFAQRLGDVPMSPIPSADSVRSWIDAIDQGNLRRQITDQSGIMASNFSAQLTENRLAPGLAILASHICGVSAASGLVVSGLITPAEAGWPLYGRENALSELGDIELIDLVSTRLALLKRVTKKKIEATEDSNHFLEMMG